MEATSTSCAGGCAGVGSRFRTSNAPIGRHSMDLTPFHAKYLAHELTHRCVTVSARKLTSEPSDDRASLDPDRIEAAHVELRNWLSRWARLTDDVEFKEARLIQRPIAQPWATCRRPVLFRCRHKSLRDETPGCRFKLPRPDSSDNSVSNPAPTQGAVKGCTTRSAV